MDRARWFTLQFFAHRTEYLVVHDSPLAFLGVPPFGVPIYRLNSGGSAGGGGSDNDDNAEGGSFVRNTAGEVYFTNYRVRLSLFRRALLYESAHCQGPWTMVATMRAECAISPPADVFGMYPEPRARARVVRSS
jgi:hypothetical protein